MSLCKNGLNKAKESIAAFMKEEDGVGVVEIVLICVVLVALVVLFRGTITEVVGDALDAVDEDAAEVYD